MKVFHAMCKGFGKWGVESIPKGSECVIRLDSCGGIELVSVNGKRVETPLNAYELHEYFTFNNNVSL